MKAVYSDTIHRWRNTYYVHDATGNIMATYCWNNMDSFHLTDVPIYGSARIASWSPSILLWYNDSSGLRSGTSSGMGLWAGGSKVYELNNHLGNVLSTVSDRKLRVYSGGHIDHYLAEVITATDYYPFGMPMLNRSFGAGYRFGFNGKEQDNEVEGKGDILDFGSRIYDSRLGKWLSVDLEEKKSTSWTPYRFGFDNPMRFSDPNGKFEIDEATAAKYPNYASFLKNISETYASKPQAFRDAFKQYSELSDAQINKLLEYRVVKNGTPIVPNQSTPRIIVKDLGTTAHGAPINGQTPITGTPTSGGGLTNASTEGDILINKGIVDKYEQEMNEAKNSNPLDVNNVGLQSAEIVLESTTFHEGTHYGDAIADHTLDLTSSTKEGGKAFEVAAYGADVDQTNAESIVRNTNYNGAATQDNINAVIKNAAPKMQTNSIDKLKVTTQPTK